MRAMTDAQAPIMQAGYKTYLNVMLAIPANAIDIDDGFRLVKGYPEALIIRENS